MSEINANPDELIEEVGYTVEDADVIPTPIDPTLSHAGEAADAKAVGDAIKNISAAFKINDVQAEDGVFHVYPDDIPMSDSEGAQSLGDVISDLGSKSGADILLEQSSTETISQAVARLEDAIEEASGGADERIEEVARELQSYETSNDAAVQSLQTQIDTEYTDEQVHQMVQDVFGGGD